MKKLLLHLLKGGILYIIFIVSLCSLAYVGYLWLNAKNTGTTLGDAVGSGVGKTIGSLEAIYDYKEAYEEGKLEGLNAEDTKVEVAEKIKEIEKLEVLVASAKFKDVHKVGDTYAALYLLKGDAVFTIDLSKSVIKDNESENTLYIDIPEPELDLIINHSSIEKVADYQKKWFNGSSEDGYDAYINSLTKISENAEECLANYDSLMEEAKESARTQVEEIVNSVSVERRNVAISFMKGDTDDK